MYFKIAVLSLDGDSLHFEKEVKQFPFFQVEGEINYANSRRIEKCDHMALCVIS